jgi:hypothetical protein
MNNVLEFAPTEEPAFDFCAWQYEPLAPSKGRLRSASLLFHTFAVAGSAKGMLDLVDAIRRRFGVANTVWGVKQIDGALRWEFYFYDYRRRQRERSISAFIDILRPFTRCDLLVEENTPYFMFSIDIDEALVTGSRTLDEIHVYIGNTGSTVSSGICYSLKREEKRIENFYFFFDAKREREKIRNKAVCSMHFDETRFALDEIIWTELRDCSVIVVANKKLNDGVYFSRINVAQFRFFLDRMGYPEEICHFVREHHAELSHLLFDVGFDYRIEDGHLRILKSGYYGIF